jgi:hypothetical protein
MPTRNLSITCETPTTGTDSEGVWARIDGVCGITRIAL